MSSSTIQGSAMFPTRKRRQQTRDVVVDGLKQQETKRPFAAGDKKRDGGSGSLSAAALPSLGVVAGATAPKPSNSHVQEAIHKEVQYSREGNSKGNVPANTLAVFRFVKEAFVIPNNFEKDHKFGPLSGVSHELRVVSAFMAGQLEARTEEAKGGVKMCLECGAKGHFPRHCPLALLYE
ncbi:unnamed protein product [Ectocarpus sp. CCAP 1310/34]|nr:unnamed protein product [Ectocarpus sp. CCAP 1310/34]